MKYRFIDHTADAGIEAFGRDMAELFASAAGGMYALMTDLESVRPLESRDIAVEAESPEGLLTAWLLELLFLTETEGLIFCRFEVEKADSKRLQARACGEPFDAERNSAGPSVKAVTRHQLAVQQHESGLKARIIFDI